MWLSLSTKCKCDIGLDGLYNHTFFAHAEFPKRQHGSWKSNYERQNGNHYANYDGCSPQWRGVGNGNRDGGRCEVDGANGRHDGYTVTLSGQYRAG